MLRLRCSLGLVALLAGCGASSPQVSATPWPEADALFRSEPRWLGGDAAYSVDLGDERVLWLFGDSFVATSDRLVRSESVMVRNTVALQQGLDPSTATIDFAWREAEGRPASFFADGEADWLWPQHGIALSGALTLFLSRVCPDPSPDSLGFRTCGWTAVRVDSPGTSPLDWEPRELEVPEAPFDGVGGVAVLRLQGYVYAYVVEEPGDHDIFLLRWPEEAFVGGDLSAPEWWRGPGDGYAAESSAPPAEVMGTGATEMSVSATRGRQGLVAIQSRGFGATTIAGRYAHRPEGPWTSMEDLFRPPESDRQEAFVYAGKGHPELSGADLVVTYAANAWDLSELVADDSLYFPRFVRLVFTE